MTPPGKSVIEKYGNSSRCVQGTVETKVRRKVTLETSDYVYKF